MKNLTIKLLLSALVLGAGSVLAMGKTLGAQKASDAMVKIMYDPKAADFEAAKIIINTIPRADINAIDNFVGGNLLDLATSRYTQFHDPRYKELMDFLVSKGATRSQGIGGFTPPQD